MTVSLEHKIFDFKTPSGTSRGILTEKHAWFLRIEALGKTGLGECSIIPGLSPDYENEKQYEQILQEVKKELGGISWEQFTLVQGFELLEKIQAETNIYSHFKEYPSILFGIESAILNWSNAKNDHFFDTDFSQGKLKIPINGLVWMGTMSFMRDQMHEKIEQGFNCIKMKVGAIDFAAEMEIMEDFRRHHSIDEMTLRLDANGAFTKQNVREKLTVLSQFQIHSIEQPIAPGQRALMAKLCRENILPIALDEELIGIHSRQEKEDVLDEIQPQYIILKPSLHGGILSSKEWIELAEAKNIGWWITSALESNVGLACIAEFTSTFSINKHHGLGTGSLYVNNIPSKLTVERGMIFYT